MKFKEYVNKKTHGRVEVVIVILVTALCDWALALLKVDTLMLHMILYAEGAVACALIIARVMEHLDKKEGMRLKQQDQMLTAAEIAKMVEDFEQWLADQTEETRE